MDIGKVLSGLYASEIPGGIAWVPDGGFDWWVGSIEFENASARGGEETVEEAAQAMHAAALRLFPESEYARKFDIELKEKETRALIMRIKTVRAKTGCGLKEAKVACEANATTEGAIQMIRRNAEARVKELEAACRRQVENIERWMKTGEPAGPKESKAIYEQLKAALRAVED